MPKFASLAALASLLLTCAPAGADWRAPIVGAKPILPARFVPFQWVRADAAAAAWPTATPDTLREADAPIAWIAPLFDRRLSPAERAANIAPDLLDAILRIEPLYDPTRLYGPESAVRMSVSAGTATMDSVFADRWRRAAPDANVNRRVDYIAKAWQSSPDVACDGFTKARPRAGYEQPALTELTQGDCEALIDSEADGYDAPPVPIVAGLLDIPVFAAPLPGERMSSKDFWAAQREKIARITAELRMRRSWHGGKQGIKTEDLARR